MTCLFALGIVTTEERRPLVPEPDPLLERMLENPEVQQAIREIDRVIERGKRSDAPKGGTRTEPLAKRTSLDDRE